jgi:membrane dipeptidase
MNSDAAQPHSCRLGLGIGLIIAAAGLAFPPGTGFAADEDDRLEAQAAAIHDDAIVIDGHNDVATWIIDYGFDLGMDGWEPKDRSAWLHLLLRWLPWRPSAERLRTHTDLRRIERGGLDGQFFSVWVGPEYHDPDHPTAGTSRARAHAIIDVLMEQAKRHSGSIEMALTAADVRRIAAEGKLAMLLGIEGGHSIEHDLGTLRAFHRRGVRYMTLTWSFSHSWADASGDPLQGAEVRHGGLTDFGRAVVREMNDLGMLVDISHVSDDTFWDTLETTRAAVIASHSSVRAIAPHPRNLSDEMLRAVGANGGVVLINFAVVYLDPRKTTVWKVAADWVKELGGSETSVSNVADHIDHVVQTAGIDHVGLGSDFDGTPLLPSGLRNVGEFPNVTVELLRRGYSAQAIRKVLGENLLRVLEQAERLAIRSRPEAAAEPGVQRRRQTSPRREVLRPRAASESSAK